MIKAIKNRFLIAAVKKNDPSKVQKLIKSIEDLNLKDSRGRSLLALAYHYNSSDVIDILREQGIREEINRLYNYAKRCLNDDQLNEAKKRFEELKEYFPNDSSVFYYLGFTYFKIWQNDNIEYKIVFPNKTNLDSSVGYIINALELNNEDNKLDELKLANANYILSYFHYIRQEFQEAKKFSKAAIENVPEHEGAKEIQAKIPS